MPTATAINIRSQYDRAEEIREIKVTKKLAEVVNAKEVSVDYYVDDAVTESWNCDYDESFVGGYRRNSTRTREEEVETHLSHGRIETSYTCTNRLDFSYQNVKDTGSYSIIVDANVRASSMLIDCTFGVFKWDAIEVPLTVTQDMVSLKMGIAAFDATYVKFELTPTLNLFM